MQLEQSPSRSELALNRIAQAIRVNPDTGGGVQLRQFLWSLYNMHHLVNLWTLVSRLDRDLSTWVAEVLHAALLGNLQERDLKKALMLSGEMDRWDQEQRSNEAVARFEDARFIIQGVVRGLAPCRTHTELTRLLRDFAEVRTALEDPIDAGKP